MFDFTNVSMFCFIVFIAVFNFSCSTDILSYTRKSSRTKAGFKLGSLLHYKAFYFNKPFTPAGPSKRPALQFARFTTGKLQVSFACCAFVHAMSLPQLAASTRDQFTYCGSANVWCGKKSNITILQLNFFTLVHSPCVGLAQKYHQPFFCVAFCCL